MRRFFGRVALLLIPVTVVVLAFVVWVLPKWLQYRHGPNTETQIRTSFSNAILKDYQVLILGNSRVYRGLNPDMFTLPTYNFAHDNDSYNQMYYKLVYLLDHDKRFDIVLLGVDYFQFGIFSDTRNYVYMDYFAEEYLDDYPGPHGYRAGYYVNLFKNFKLDRLFSRTSARIKSNGQYVNEGHASPESLMRDSVQLPIQLKYFDAIIKLAASRSLKVFLVMPPLLREELTKYSHNYILKFENFFLNYSDPEVQYLNFSTDHPFRRSDFSDFTHLNSIAADRWTKLVDSAIIETVKRQELLLLPLKETEND